MIRFFHNLYNRYKCRHQIDLVKAVHTQAIRITAADETHGFLTQDDMDTITFQDIIVPAFKLALAMGTNFRHRNCFTPNNITSVFCSESGR